MKSPRLISILSGTLILLALCACASHPALTCKPVPLSPTAAAPLPPPLEFSKCLREIVAVGQQQQAQISPECSTFLRLAPTK